MTTEGFRLSASIPAVGATLYFAWIDAAQHAAMTGAPAKSDPTAGGKFSAKNGEITGRYIVLDVGRRIVMSFRTKDFPRDAHDSRVELNFEVTLSGVRVTVLHSEIPAGLSDKCRALWNDFYFGPLRAFFSKRLPDPHVAAARSPQSTTDATGYSRPSLTRVGAPPPPSQPALVTAPRGAQAASKAGSAATAAARRGAQPATAPRPESAKARALARARAATKAAGVDRGVTAAKKALRDEKRRGAKATKKPAVKATKKVGVELAAKATPKPAKSAPAKAAAKPAKSAPKPAKSAPAKAAAKPASKPVKKAPAKPAPKPVKKAPAKKKR